MLEANSGPYEIVSGSTLLITSILFQTQIPKRKSKKQQAAEAKDVAVVQEQKKKKKGLFSFFRGATENLLQELKSTLIQIFHRPSNDEINKAILRELKRIRSQLRKSSKHENVEAQLSSDSDSESEALQVTDAKTKEDKKELEVVNSLPKPAAEPEEEFDVIKEDPNNPAWLRDPELGDGEVSIYELFELPYFFFAWLYSRLCGFLRVLCREASVNQWKMINWD